MIGTYLKTKDKESIWIQCFQALDEAENVVSLDEKLWAKLRVSYDRLGSQEKNMFLDAASFFSNSTWNLREAKACWRVLYGKEDLRWQTLVDLSLVYNVTEEKSIQMHEQLRSLGIRLASGWGTGGRCRTWTPKNVPSRFNSSNYNESIAEGQFYSNDPGSSSTGMATHIEVRDYVTPTFKVSSPLYSTPMSDIGCCCRSLKFTSTEARHCLVGCFSLNFFIDSCTRPFQSFTALPVGQRNAFLNPRNCLSRSSAFPT